MNSHRLSEVISGNVSANIILKDRQKVLEEFENNYPKEEQWRLLVEGSLYSFEFKSEFDLFKTSRLDSWGWERYNHREKGSLAAFFNAWNHCLQVLKMNKERQVISIDFIKELHRIVTYNVKDMLNDNEFREGYDHQEYFQFINSMLYAYSKSGIRDLLAILASSQFRDNRAALGVIKEALLENGKYIQLINTLPVHHNVVIVSELYNKIETDDLVELIWKMIEEDAVVYFPPFTEIENLVKETINYYNHHILFAKTIDEKIILIAKTIQQLERIHPFADANGRTFVNLLMNFLLMQEGLPPATLFESNIFDIYDNLLAAIKKGIANTLEIYAGNRNLFGHKQSKKAKQAYQDVLFKDNLTQTIEDWKNLKDRLEKDCSVDLRKMLANDILNTLKKDINFLFLYRLYLSYDGNFTLSLKAIKRIGKVIPREKFIELKNLLIDFNVMTIFQDINPLIVELYGPEIVMKALWLKTLVRKTLSDDEINSIINHPKFSPGKDVSSEHELRFISKSTEKALRKNALPTRKDNIIRCLYQGGYNFQFGNSLLDYAMQNCHNNIVNSLLAHPGVSFQYMFRNLYIYPIIHNQINTAQQLLAKNVSVDENIRFKNETALFIFAKFYNLEVQVKEWLNEKKKQEQRDPNFYYDNAIYLTTLELAKIVKNDEMIALFDPKPKNELSSSYDYLRSTRHGLFYNKKNLKTSESDINENSKEDKINYHSI